jgi:hypothetical protein
VAAARSKAAGICTITAYNRLIDELNKGMGPDDVIAERIARDTNLS